MNVVIMYHQQKDLLPELNIGACEEIVQSKNDIPFFIGNTENGNETELNENCSQTLKINNMVCKEDADNFSSDGTQNKFAHYQSFLHRKRKINTSFEMNKHKAFYSLLNSTLDSLIKQPEAEPFLHPVDPLKAPDYYNIIKNPIDLSTIKGKLNAGQYENCWELVDDIWLTFNNAWLYNRKNSRVYKNCSKLAALFSSIIDKPMKALGYCCGQNYVFEPKFLFCSSIKNCIIQRYASYWSYDSYQICKKCYSAFEKTTFIFQSSAETITIKKEMFVENVNDLTRKEPFIQCTKCGIKCHKICVLHLEDDSTEGYLCNICFQMSDQLKQHIKFNSKDLLKTRLGSHIEDRVNTFLENAGCNSRVNIRIVHQEKKSFDVMTGAKDRFVKTGIWPNQFPYTKKTLLAFQQIGEMDFCFFAMFVQEYNHKCPYPNTRRVYISYLDSVHFFTPKHLRTLVYHEIFLGYLDYVKNLGFVSAHLWSCPAKKGEDYVFYHHPKEQKNPSIKILLQWYKIMLNKGIEQGIVKDYKNIYKQAIEDNFKSASELPYFEEDFWPSTLENEICKLEKTAVNQVNVLSINKIVLPSLSMNKKVLPPTSKQKGQKINESNNGNQIIKFMKRKKKGKFSKKSTNSSIGDALTEKILTVMFKYKEVFLVINLEHSSSDLPTLTDPDPLIPSEIICSRETFLEFCRENDFEFASLRRALYSTMMFLCELHKEQIMTFSCNQSKITLKNGYHCNTCKKKNCLVCKIYTPTSSHKAEITPSNIDGTTAEKCNIGLSTSNHQQLSPSTSNTLTDSKNISYSLLSDNNQYLKRKNITFDQNDKSDIFSTLSSRDKERTQHVLCSSDTKSHNYFDMSSRVIDPKVDTHRQMNNFVISNYGLVSDFSKCISQPLQYNMTQEPSSQISLHQLNFVPQACDDEKSVKSNANISHLNPNLKIVESGIQCTSTLMDKKTEISSDLNVDQNMAYLKLNNHKTMTLNDISVDKNKFELPRTYNLAKNREPLIHSMPLSTSSFQTLTGDVNVATSLNRSSALNAIKNIPYSVPGDARQKLPPGFSKNQQTSVSLDKPKVLNCDVESNIHSKTPFFTQNRNSNSCVIAKIRSNKNLVSNISKKPPEISANKQIFTVRNSSKLTNIVKRRKFVMNSNKANSSSNLLISSLDTNIKSALNNGDSRNFVISEKNQYPVLLNEIKTFDYEKNAQNIKVFNSNFNIPSVTVRNSEKLNVSKEAFNSKLVNSELKYSSENIATKQVSVSVDCSKTAGYEHPVESHLTLDSKYCDNKIQSAAFQTSGNFAVLNAPRQKVSEISSNKKMDFSVPQIFNSVNTTKPTNYLDNTQSFQTFSSVATAGKNSVNTIFNTPTKYFSHGISVISKKEQDSKSSVYKQRPMAANILKLTNSENCSLKPILESNKIEFTMKFEDFASSIPKGNSVKQPSSKMCQVNSSYISNNVSLQVNPLEYANQVTMSIPDPGRDQKTQLQSNVAVINDKSKNESPVYSKLNPNTTSLHSAKSVETISNDYCKSNFGDLQSMSVSREVGLTTHRKVEESPYSSSDYFPDCHQIEFDSVKQHNQKLVISENNDYLSNKKLQKSDTGVKVSENFHVLKSENLSFSNTNNINALENLPAQVWNTSEQDMCISLKTDKRRSKFSTSQNIYADSNKSSENMQFIIPEGTKYGEKSYTAPKHSTISVINSFPSRNVTFGFSNAMYPQSTEVIKDKKHIWDYSLFNPNTLCSVTNRNASSYTVDSTEGMSSYIDLTIQNHPTIINIKHNSQNTLNKMHNSVSYGNHDFNSAVNIHSGVVPDETYVIKSDSCVQDLEPTCVSFNANQNEVSCLSSNYSSKTTSCFNKKWPQNQELSLESNVSKAVGLKSTESFTFNNPLQLPLNSSHCVEVKSSDSIASSSNQNNLFSETKVNYGSQSPYTLPFKESYYVHNMPDSYTDTEVEFLFQDLHKPPTSQHKISTVSNNSHPLPINYIMKKRAVEQKQLKRKLPYTKSRNKIRHEEKCTNISQKGVLQGSPS